MAENISNAKELRQFIDERAHAASDQRIALANRTGIDECYYEGVQWLNQTPMARYMTSSGVVRLSPNINPDLFSLLFIANLVTRATIKVSVMTRPQDIEAQVSIGERAVGVSDAVAAQTLEDALAMGISTSGFLQAARRANLRRCIDGCHGIMFTLEAAPRTVDMGAGSVEFNDRVLRAGIFHPIRLILDPAVDEKDLAAHDEVIYQDVWTYAKIKRVFPKAAARLKPDEMKTMEVLAPHEMAISTLSDYRLFSRFSRYAKTKAARVYYVYCKDQTGRFGRMYAAIEGGDDQAGIIWTNEDAVNPFGGTMGLPLFLLHAHDRADSMWSISDVAMMKDAQDRHNLAHTWFNRGAQNYTAVKHRIDRRWFGNKVTDEAIRNQFNNRTNGLIIGNPTANDRTISPPDQVPGVPPHPFLMESADRAENTAMQNVFRSQQSFGENPKTHIPGEVYKLFGRYGDQVLSARVDEDIGVYEKACDLILGTVCLLTQQQSPTMAQALVADKFDEQDVGVLLSTNPFRPASCIEVSESSIRYRGPDEKRDDLIGLAQQQQIDPATLRRGLAEFDFAATDDDKRMRQEIGKMVANLLRTGEWETLPLGEYNQWCIASLREALFDPICKQNPQIRQMVKQAILMQEQVVLADMQAQAMAQNPPQPAPAGEEAGEPAEMPGTVGELVDQLASEGSAD